MGSLVPPLEKLQAELRRRLPDSKIHIDAPTAEDGTWWIDIEMHGNVATVEWRPKTGFGVSGAGSGYGEGPDVVVDDAESAAEHIIRLLEAESVPDTQKRIRVS